MNSLGIYCIIAGMAVGAVLAAYAFIAPKPEKPGSYKKITAEKAKELLDSGGFLVLDVRTKEEYDKGHIEGALLIPHDKIMELAPIELSAKPQGLLVHCQTGVRSQLAAKRLIEMGYTSVYDFGGIADWPYEIVTASQ